MDYEQGLRMARWMTDMDWEIRVALRECSLIHQGVVALRFSDHCQEMKIEILDEPYDENIRVILD